MSETLKKFACEYMFSIEGNIIFVTRYNNHRDMILDDKWAVYWLRGDGNPWYLNTDGTWQYKHGCTYATADDAYEHCLKCPPKCGTELGLDEDTEPIPLSSEEGNENVKGKSFGNLENATVVVCSSLSENGLSMYVCVKSVSLLLKKRAKNDMYIEYSKKTLDFSNRT